VSVDGSVGKGVGEVVGFVEDGKDGEEFIVIVVVKKTTSYGHVNMESAVFIGDFREADQRTLSVRGTDQR